ncbi:MAG: PKD domain-containing protein, partial [Bacteroidetes bacterium]|nr:PKD domain-containing protein [Bacteroidota bacterium]
PWHLYAQPGTYFACLSVYDSTAGGTCTSTWCDSVHIILLPPSCNAQFYYSSLSYPDSVHFGSSGGNTSSAVYSWDFGDGGTSNSLNPWHLYAQPGTYFACLNVYDSTAGGICTSAWCDSVHVILLPPSCNAQFYYSSLNNPDSVHFVSPGNNTPAAVYSWDFGDGGTSNAITPWHLYAQHGIYYACLTVNDSTASGTCTSTWCDSVRAFPAPPNCDAEFTYVILNYPDSVRFLPLGNYHPGVNYTWDFGDGTFSSNFNPWHLYAQDGVYFVCLTVYDSTAGGTCTATWCDSVRALPGPPACDAQFTYHSVNYADNIQFVSPANPAGSTYSWTFGDGAVSGNASPLHIYTQSGTYYVCLTVYNSNVSGTCTSTWCDSVLVLPVIPLCNAAFSFVHPVNSDSIQFIVSGNNHPGTLYYWHFDDSTYSTDMNPWHRYNQNGMYHVCLDVYDSTSAGTCTSTWCDTVLIDFILPNCNADFLQYSQFNPYHVYFIPASNNQSTAKYHWDFGDGNFSGERFPAHFYHHSGTYTICLEVSDSLLSRTCSASRCRVLTIPDTKYLLVFPNPVHQNESIIVRNIVSLFNCRILDGTGRLIWNEDNIIETEKIIDLNGISAGIYFVEVSGANQPASTWKLIVLE